DVLLELDVREQEQPARHHARGDPSATGAHPPPGDLLRDDPLYPEREGRVRSFAPIGPRRHGDLSRDRLDDRAHRGTEPRLPGDGGWRTRLHSWPHSSPARGYRGRG